MRCMLRKSQFLMNASMVIYSARRAFLVLKSFFCETSFFPDQFGKWERSKVSLSILFTLYDLHERFPSGSMRSLCEFHHTTLWFFFSTTNFLLPRSLYRREQTGKRDTAFFFAFPFPISLCILASDPQFEIAIMRRQEYFPAVHREC